RRRPPTRSSGTKPPSAQGRTKKEGGFWSPPATYAASASRIPQPLRGEGMHNPPCRGLESPRSVPARLVPCNSFSFRALLVLSVRSRQRRRLFPHRAVGLVHHSGQF